MRSWSKEVAAALVPVLVVAAGFFQLVRGPDALIVDPSRPSLDHAGPPGARGVGNDLTFFWLPKYIQAVGQLRADGRLASWDPSGFAGRPALGNPQSGRHYPLLWLAWMADHPAALGWLVVGHLVLAGVGVYGLTRTLGVSKTAAAVAAGTYAVSPYLIAQTFEGHYPHVWSASWYPWAFLAALRALRGEVPGLLTLPPALALTFLTGHPQEWYYLVLALSFGVVVKGGMDWRRGERRRTLMCLAVWTAFLMLGLALCAAEIVPVVSAQRWTLRSAELSLKEVNRYSVHPVHALQLLSPFALGTPQAYFGPDNYWESLLSIGLAPLLLALIGAFWHPEKRVRRAVVVLVVVCVAFGFGRKLGVYALAYQLVPGMGRFRVPARSLFLANMGAAVLVALGVDRLVGCPWPDGWPDLKRQLRWLLGWLAVAMLLTFVLGTIAWPSDLDGPVGSGTHRASGGHNGTIALRGLMTVARDPVVWAVVFVSLVLVFLPKRMSLGPRTVGFGLGLLALGEVTASAQRLLVMTPASEICRPDPLASRLAGSARKEPDGPYRLAASPWAVPDLSASIVGAEKALVNDSFQIQHAAEVYERLYPVLEDTPHPKGREQPMDRATDEHKARLARMVLGRMSVLRLATTRPTLLESEETATSETSAAAKRVRLTPVASPLPRCYVVPRARVLARRGFPVSRELGETDPRSQVILDGDKLPPGERQPFTPAQRTATGPDRVTIDVTTTAPGFLVVTETWMPGWSATVNGSPEDVLLGDFWLQVVPIRSPGAHRVELVYRAPGEREGRAVAAAALVIWGVLAVGLVVRRVRG